MIHTARQLWRLLNAKERRRSTWLGLLMLLTSAVEMSGLISVVPLVAALTSSADPCAGLGDVAGALCSRLLPSRSPHVLALWAFALIALSNLLAFSVIWLSARLTWSVWRRISAHVFAAYLEKPYEFFFDSHSSTVVKNIVYETERLSATVFMPMMILLSRLIVTLGVVLLVLAVDPRLSLAIILLLAGVYIAVYRQLQGRVRRSGELAFHAREHIGRITTETIGGIRELRMLDCGPHFSGNFGRAADTLAKQYVYGATVAVMPRYIIETAAFALMLGVAVYLSSALGGWQTAAPLLAFYVFVAYRLLPQFQQIYANAMLVQQSARVVDALAAVVIERQAAAAALALAIPDSAKGGELTPPISLESVTYQYPGTVDPVLEQASMQIPRRATVGLVGSTGAGKSTVIDLVAGLLHPTAGAITLSGVPLDAMRAGAWRSRIGYVPQATFLLDDTIRRNIAFGLPDDQISQEQVERAARAANIHDFIAQLPARYDTSVGERGVRLSGGQRQRLVIARALYRDPEMLIFDEATSALDAETEQAVMEAIRVLSHQKTLLIISHRPAMLQWCDLIYEVADGKLRRREAPETDATA